MLKMTIKREYTEEHMEIMKKSIKKRFGRFEKLKKLLSVRGCATPEISEAYLMMLTINEGEKIEEEIIIEEKKIFNAFTAKRFELIEYINTHPPTSLKELARKTGRDYKNVYDDTFAMERFFVLNVVKSGKEKVPVGKIVSLEIKV